jgi:hypothetical protein
MHENNDWIETNGLLGSQTSDTFWLAGDRFAAIDRQHFGEAAGIYGGWAVGIWAIHEKHFSQMTPILDLMHALNSAHEAADGIKGGLIALGRVQFGNAASPTRSRNSKSIRAGWNRPLKVPPMSRERRLTPF